MRGIVKSLTVIGAALAIWAAGAAIAAVGPTSPLGEAAALSAAPSAVSAPLRQLALEAGERSAILAQCGIGPAPVDFAFGRTLDRAGLDRADRDGLWQRYRSARADAAVVLARQGAEDCAGAPDLLTSTVHDLQ
jgi:hypothetical protein